MEYDKNNVFAKILEGTIEAKKIYEDEYVLAFYDADPDAQVHALVIPKGQYTSYRDFVEKASMEECAHFFKTINDIALQLDLKDGFKLVVNNGKFQHVPHLHVHILGQEIFNE
jgi:diadenosine tetraphosphate (Ap4A) HIT family hydrolase